MIQSLGSGDSKILEYLQKVNREGEPMVFYKDGEKVGELHPAKVGVLAKDLLQVMKTIRHIPPDDIEQFAKDVEEAKRIGNTDVPRDPWQS